MVINHRVRLLNCINQVLEIYQAYRKVELINFNVTGPDCLAIQVFVRIVDSKGNVDVRKLEFKQHPANHNRMNLITNTRS